MNIASRGAINWVERLVVETVQLDLIREHGGLPGIRDEAELDSALAWPRQRLINEPGSDLAALAEVYGYSLVRNHPFNDGNARVAFVVMGIFLGLHGYEIKAPQAEVVKVMTDLAAGSFSEEQLASWVRSRLARSER